jgi:6-phosphofructokinase 2
MPRILTLTLNPAIDKNTTVPCLLPEHKLRCTPPVYQPGGGGINVSRAMRKLGQDSTAVYLAGGHSGAFFTELLAQESLATLAVPIAEPTRESFVVVDTTTNQQYRFGMDGPRVSEAEWQACLDLMDRQRGVEYLVASGSLPPGVPVDFYARLAEVSRRMGTRMVLDTSGEPLRQAAEACVFLLKPNLNELARLSGVEKLELHEVDDAAQDLVRRSCAELVVVSLGPQGALLASRDELVYAPAPTVKKRSTVGAGDSMVAGLTLALAKGWPLADVVRYGVACGSAATMNLGTELCHPEDVQRLFEAVRVRSLV